MQLERHKKRGIFFITKPNRLVLCRYIIW
jgi:hypothetical protein